MHLFNEKYAFVEYKTDIYASYSYYMLMYYNSYLLIILIFIFLRNSDMKKLVSYLVNKILMLSLGV